MTDGEAEALPTPCEGYGYCPDELVDAGTGPWMSVAREAVLETCGWDSNRRTPLWEAVRPTLVAADCTFAGDDEAFWALYSTGVYAPDLRKWEGNR